MDLMLGHALLTYVSTVPLIAIMEQLALRSEQSTYGWTRTY